MHGRLATKSLFSKEVIDIQTFHWLPRNTVKPKTQAMNTRVEFQSGLEQINANAVKPKKSWELSIEGTKDTLDEIQAFFDYHSIGGKPFYYNDLDGVQHTVTFMDDSFEVNGKLGWDEDGYGVKGFDVTVKLRKVWKA